jgi:hypothetical protein
MKLFALAAAGIAATALGTTLALAPAATADELPKFDFSDCPAPPANADPGTWRCEAFVSQGELTIGGREIPLGEMRLTFSEGRVGGRYAQVFGALRHAPARVPGLAGTTLELRYGGYSDFQSNDERRGELDVYAVLRHHDPAIPPTVLSQTPPTFHFGVVDPDLALPATHGCGALGKVVDRRLGLPSPSGQNTFHQTTYVQYRAL